MPINEYYCEDCSNIFEYFKIKTDDKPVCPKCSGTKLKKFISKSNFELKGEGWAKTGYSKTK